VGAAEALGGLQQDGLGYAFGVFTDLAVPEADYGPAFDSEVAGTSLVSGGLDVLAAVDLDHQPRLAVGEVGDVRADGELAGEFGPIAGEQAPEGAFLGCGLAAERTGALGLL
jgi:hypothetical protein